MVDEGIDVVNELLLGVFVTDTGWEGVDLGLKESDGIAHGDRETPALLEEGDVELDLRVKITRKLLLGRSFVVGNYLINK